MTVNVNETPGAAVISVAGELDISTAPELRDAISTAIGNGARQVVVDLDGLRFMDSAGLNVFVGAVRQLGSDGSLRVVAGRSHTRKVFTISGLDRLIPLYDSLGEACGDAPGAVLPDAVPPDSD